MTSSTITFDKANQGSAKSCGASGRRRNFLRFGSLVAQAARRIYPHKTAINLSAVTGHPVRTWEYWLSTERLSGEAVGALIACEDGMQILDAIAADSPWWRHVREALALADKRHHALQEAASALQSLTETTESFRVPNTGRAVDRAVARGRMGRAAARPKKT